MRPEIDDIITFDTYSVTNNITSVETSKKKKTNFGRVTKFVQDQQGVISSFMIANLSEDGTTNGLNTRFYFLKSQHYEPRDFTLLGKLPKNQTITEAFPECFL